MVKKRNIALAVVLSIITCGLYGIYWFICLNNDANALTPDDSYTTGGGMAQHRSQKLQMRKKKPLLVRRLQKHQQNSKKWRLLWKMNYQMG